MFSKQLFCQRLRNLRQNRKLTVEQLGKEFDVSKQTVSRWELGDRLPPLDVTTALADYFDVSLDYLVGRSDKLERK
jgi:transcriptional regulator with XRE-family HTH domain